MKQEKKVIYSFAIILALALGAVSFSALAKNDNAKNSNTKADKTSSSQGKNKNATLNVVDYEKPDKAKGETNAQIHKEKSQEVTKNLKEVAVQEEATGNVAVSDDLEEIVTEQEQTQTEVVEAIEDVESRGKVKTFIIGQNYKNLGQLRSEIVQNRNQIRKLTKALTQTQTEEGETLSGDLETLLREQQRLKTIIADNEDKFSLFGWVFRYMSGYVRTPIDDSVDDQLADEAQTAIDEADANQEQDVTENVVPGTDTTTPVTDTTTPVAPVPPTTNTTLPTDPAV